MDLAAAVAREFDLGPPSGPATPVEGGLLNRMWRVDTTTGSYAAKQLTHTHVVARADYRRAFDVERAALDAGLALPPPVAHPAHGGPLGDLTADGMDGTVTVLVHRWIDGRQLDPEATVSPEVARSVARDLARLHGLGLDPTAWPTAGVWGHAPDRDVWRALAERATETGLDLGWSRLLISHEGELADMSDRFLAEDGPTGSTVVSHRDADAKNLLIVDDRPMLIDWETCGPTTVGLELGKELLDLAGGHHGPLHPQTAAALLEGYAEVAEALPEPSSSWYAEWFMACSSFAAYNVDLALADGTDPSADDRPSQILSTLIPVLIDTAARWDDLTDQLTDLVEAVRRR